VGQGKVAVTMGILCQYIVFDLKREDIVNR
jgi:hypothetical protein